MEQRRELRASDQDRQVVADRLREAVNEGRIDLSEYDERLASAYAAKTYGELADVTADLPPPQRQTVVPRQGAPLATEQQIADAEKAAFERRGRVRRRLWGMWRPWAAASTITTGIWLATVIADGELKDFWPIWVIVPWGFVLLALSVGAVGRSDEERGELGARGGAGERWSSDDRMPNERGERRARRRRGCC